MNSLAVLRRFNRVAGQLAPTWTARLADRRFWRPRRLPMRDWEQDIAAQAERITTRFGLSALRWGGPGPTVLMLHGWEGRPTQFAALIAPLLAAGRQVIALDAPAHGRSPGDEADPVAFADALLEISVELPRLEAVIGHSMGAAAVAIALSRGLRADRAVLIAAPASLGGVLARGADVLGLPDAARAALHHLAARRTGVAVDQLDIARLGSDLRTPVLIVHDADDSLVPVSEAQRIAAAWPGAQLLQTEQLGHWRVLRDPRVIRAIEQFSLRDHRLPAAAARPTSVTPIHAAAHAARGTNEAASKPCLQAPLRRTLEVLSHYG